MILLGLFAFTAAVTATPVPTFTEDDAKIFINESSSNFFDFFDDLSHITFKDDSNDNFFEVLLKLSILQTAARNLTSMAKEAAKYPFETYTDEKVKLAMRNIRMSSYLYILDEEYFTKVLIAIKHLKDLNHDKDICNYRDSHNCKMSYMPDVHNIVSKTNDEKELKFYWNAFRKQNSNYSANEFNIFVELFKKAAKLTGTEPLNLWYRILMDSKFLIEMEKVMKQIEPFYKQVHSYIRYELNKQYGNDIVPLNKPIPYHLYDKVLVQNWNTGHVIDPPYPDYHLPDLDKHTLKLANEYTYESKLLRAADKFYESMDISYNYLEFLDFDSTNNNHIKKVEEDKSGGNDCVAEIYAQSPFYHIKACPQITFKKYLQTHGWSINAYFVQAKKSLPYGNFQSYNFEQPAGEAIILSASSPKHLEAMGFISKEDSTSEPLMQNRLFKMSIHTMLNIPLFFIHSKVMDNLLSGEVEIKEINEHYWKLLKEYAGVVPPMNRSITDFDFPHTFYDDLENNHQTNKFVSEIAGYQIFRTLCDKSEIEQPSLHNCDFYNSTVAGKILKDFMKLGSTKPWRKALASITGDETGLNGDALLKYYEPISQWLSTQIENNKMLIGW